MRPLALALAIVVAAPAACDTASSSAPDVPADVSADAATDVAADALADVPADAPADVPGDPGPADPGWGPDGWTPVAPGIKDAGDFRIVWLSGTAYEMGRQQGELLHATIDEAMQFVAADPLLSIVPQMVEESGILAHLEANALPEILDECRGLVDTAGDVGLDMRSCLVLNMGDVALAFLYVGTPGEDPQGPGCSGVIATGDATPDGRVYHTRNLDWGGMDIGITQQYPTIFVRQPAGDIPHVFVGFPLNLSPYTGMNAEGISLGTHQADPFGPGEMALHGRSNVQMTARILRLARTIAEVESLVRSEVHMTTGILTAGDGAGNTGAIFEMSATGVGVLRPDEHGVTWATNHFTSTTMAEKDDPEKGKGTLRRWARLQQLVPPGHADSRWGDLGPATLAEVMQDITSAETGLAPTMAELEALEWDNGDGLGSNGPMHFAIFDPGRRLFWVSAGLPPLHVKPYRCFSLDALLGLPGASPCEPAAVGGS